MISDFENLSLSGSNGPNNHTDPFTHTGECHGNLICGREDVLLL